MRETVNRQREIQREDSLQQKEQDCGQINYRGDGQKRMRQRRLLLLALLLCGSLFVTIAGSMAYWTDRIETSGSVGTLSIGIAYEEAALNIGRDKAVLPGDSLPFSFQVNNTGQVSADVKPVIKVRSSKPMLKGKSGYYLTGKDGGDISAEYDAVYLNGETAVGNPETEAYDAVVYTAKYFTTIAGSVQKDETLDRDSRSGKLLTGQTYQCCLKLDEKTDNSYMGAAVEISVDTYAIQHRNTDGVRENGAWMTTAKQAVKE